jgi:hypothetical protein|tara:strand:- start:802 stop:1044 length:243 start_codon:yes stop_codon:yes gene_type:complete
MENVTKLNEGLNKKELEYLIAYVEESVLKGRYTVKNINSLVSKNKDGSVRQNTSTTYEMADAWVEELKFLEPLLEKLQAY